MWYFRDYLIGILHKAFHARHPRCVEYTLTIQYKYIIDFYIIYFHIIFLAYIQQNGDISLKNYKY
jgi:hypothetical protein